MCATHVVTADEISGDYLRTMPDLEPFLVDSTWELPQTRTASGDRELSVYLAKGTLRNFSPGTLLVVQIDGRTLRVRGVDRRDVVRPPAQLRSSMRRFVRDNTAEPGGLGALVHHVRQSEPALFSEPTLPLTELLSRYSIARCGDLLALDDFDFDAYLRDERVRELVCSFDIGVDEATAVDAMRNVLEFQSSGSWDSEAEIAALAEHAASIDSAQALAAVVAPWLYGVDSDGSSLQQTEVLAACVAAVSAADTNGARVLLWICATLSSVLGHPLQLRTYADRLLAESQGWAPGLELAAGVAIDAGDCNVARTLLRESKGRKQFWFSNRGSELTKYVGPDSDISALGSTGSVLFKARRFALEDGPSRLSMLETAERLWGGPIDGLPPDVLLALRSDPKVVSFGLCEGGLLRRFAQCRCALLPEAEQQVFDRVGVSTHKLCRVFAAGGAEPRSVVVEDKDGVLIEGVLLPDVPVPQVGVLCVVWMAEIPVTDSVREVLALHALPEGVSATVVTEDSEVAEVIGALLRTEYALQHATR
ncbi:hypothetical protein GCM10011410_24190 [Hoyosella rhizosphaerae]|uniref:Uncharacterized protein n=1 Tax=Hoyosella rhizosphaerae TaxID=1755582 RepID=A0A916XFW0_9ACTN|nr:hypothetical protein GCM10011410_24190 [Hoyosella rhizosphaerae]